MLLAARNLFGGEYIECDGGKKLPTARVNDDFCDCKDGADEPGTSACSTGRFFCINKGYRGSYIPSSWVDDGRCGTKSAEALEMFWQTKSSFSTF